jgi:3-keto-5-aminohexanoate cleavage enzyme
MTHKTWLEVAVNGPWGKRVQPHLPVTVKEIVSDALACIDAGAAIIHFHAYDEATGKQKDDPELYAAIVAGIRERSDAIVYPTLPTDGSADIDSAGGAEARFAALQGLADRGLAEWGALDPGSMNFAHERELKGGRDGFLYANTPTHIRAGLRIAAALGMPMAYACYEPGFIRMGARLAAEQPHAGQPIYRLMFSDNFTFSYPPRKYGLTAFHELLKEEAPDAPWMIAGLDVDLSPILAETVALGGHVRVGLEDARHGSPRTNAEITADAAKAIRNAGGSLASPADVRAQLKAARGQA